MNMPDLEASNPALPGNEIVARIEEALERDGTHAWEDVRAMLLCGDAQIFYNDHGAWITEIMTTPRQRWLHIWIIAGQLPEVMELQQQAERFCLTKGLSHMMSGGRAGWSVLAEKDGWEKYGWRKYADMLRHEVEGV